jgi:hypothetical protein
MKFKRVHTDSNWWFSVFAAMTGHDHLLVATVPGIGCYDIAMRLSADEVALFSDRPEDFITLARDFVASRDMPIFKDRKISFRSQGPDLIETE